MYNCLKTRSSSSFVCRVTYSLIPRLICCFWNRREEVSMGRFKEVGIAFPSFQKIGHLLVSLYIIYFIEYDFYISALLDRTSISGEPPFRVCSKWSWTTLLLGGNQTCKRHSRIRVFSGANSWVLGVRLKHIRPRVGGSPKRSFALKGDSVPKCRFCENWACKKK